MIAETTIKSIARPSDPIGVFDSGVGGLSVLRELERLLPNERFIFLGDQINVPYGGKTPAQLESITSRIAHFMIQQHCKIIVVACNTATCCAIDHLRASFEIPFIGTVPAIKVAAAMTKTELSAPSPHPLPPEA